MHARKLLSILVLALLLARAGQAGAKGQLRVSTDPAGAMVMCDGVLYESTPMTVTNLDAGLHLIVVNKPGFLEIRRSVNLPAGHTAAVELKLEPATGLLLVHTIPPRADLEIEGAYCGKTPILLTELPVGRHRARVSSPGYVSKEVELVVEDRTPRKIDITLAPDSAKITVESVPPGANVSLNGVGRGVTPCEIDRVPSGENEIELTLDTYLPYQQKIKVQRGETPLIRVNLKAMPAKLTIVTDPPGAKVTVNDRPLKETPATLEALDPGDYNVRVELRGHEPQTRAVTVKQGEHRTETFQLLRNSGTLEITTEPGGVRIYVDGEMVGATKAAGGDAISEPLKVDLLPKGEHKLQLRKKGFFVLEKAFTIEENQTAALRETLKRKFTPDTIIHLRGGAEDRTGVLSKKHPNGDVELETKRGIFVTIKATEIRSIEPIPQEQEE